MKIILITLQDNGIHPRAAMQALNIFINGLMMTTRPSWRTARKMASSYGDL
jgi:hypothetical protein